MRYSYFVRFIQDTHEKITISTPNPSIMKLAADNNISLLLASEKYLSTTNNSPYFVSFWRFSKKRRRAIRLCNVLVSYYLMGI